MAASNKPQLDELKVVPIAQVNAELSNPELLAVHGVVTIIWPFNSIKKSLAFRLSESDFRLRQNGGQARIQLYGAAATSLAKLDIGPDDEILLGLEGAEWTAEDRPLPRPSMPTVPWQLSFKNKLRLKVTLLESGSTELIEIDCASAVATPEPEFPFVDSAGDENLLHDVSPDIPKSLANVKAPLTEEIPTEFHSPAFLKRQRLSYGSLFEDPWEVDGGVKGKGRKRSRFGRDSSAWRYASQSVSPEPEAHNTDNISTASIYDTTTTGLKEVSEEPAGVVENESQEPSVDDEHEKTSQAAPSDHADVPEEHGGNEMPANMDAIKALASSRDLRLSVEDEAKPADSQLLLSSSAVDNPQDVQTVDSQTHATWSLVNTAKDESSQSNTESDHQPNFAGQTNAHDQTSTEAPEILRESMVQTLKQVSEQTPSNQALETEVPASILHTVANRDMGYSAASTALSGSGKSPIDQHHAIAASATVFASNHNSMMSLASEQAFMSAALPSSVPNTAGQDLFMADVLLQATDAPIEKLDHDGIILDQMVDHKPFNNTKDQDEKEDIGDFNNDEDNQSESDNDDVDDVEPDDEEVYEEEGEETEDEETNDEEVASQEASDDGEYEDSTPQPCDSYSQPHMSLQEPSHATRESTQPVIIDLISDSDEDAGGDDDDDDDEGNADGESDHDNAAEAGPRALATHSVERGNNNNDTKEEEEEKEEEEDDDDDDEEEEEDDDSDESDDVQDDDEDDNEDDEDEDQDEDEDEDDEGDDDNVGYGYNNDNHAIDEEEGDKDNFDKGVDEDNDSPRDECTPCDQAGHSVSQLETPFANRFSQKRAESVLTVSVIGDLNPIPSTEDYCSVSQHDLSSVVGAGPEVSELTSELDVMHTQASGAKVIKFSETASDGSLKDQIELFEHDVSVKTGPSASEDDAKCPSSPLASKSSHNIPPPRNLRPRQSATPKVEMQVVIKEMLPKTRGSYSQQSAVPKSTPNIKTQAVSEAKLQGEAASLVTSPRRTTRQSSKAPPEPLFDRSIELAKACFAEKSARLGSNNRPHLKSPVTTTAGTPQSKSQIGISTERLESNTCASGRNVQLPNASPKSPTKSLASITRSTKKTKESEGKKHADGNQDKRPVEKTSSNTAAMEMDDKQKVQRFRIAEQDLEKLLKEVNLTPANNGTTSRRGSVKGQQASKIASSTATSYTNLRSLLSLSTLPARRRSYMADVDIKSINLLVVAASASTRPVRDRQRRGYGVSFVVTDHAASSLWASGGGFYHVHMFLPHMQQLPTVNIGDGVLMRSFSVAPAVYLSSSLSPISSFTLTNTDTSQIAVFGQGDGDALQVNDGSVTVEEAEEVFERTLMRWWHENLDAEARASAVALADMVLAAGDQSTCDGDGASGGSTIGGGTKRKKSVGGKM